VRTLAETGHRRRTLETGTAGGKGIYSDEEAAEKLWHLRRGFEVAFFISFLVLVFGLVFHLTRQDVYLDTFLGSRAAAGGISAVRALAPGAGVTGWLWWVLARGISNLGGRWTVVFLAVLLVTAGFGIVLAVLRRSTNVVIAGALLAAAAYFGRPYFAPGGQAAGFFLFSVLGALLIESTKGTGRRIWLAVPVMALWVNMDISWPVGAALCVVAIPAVLMTRAPGKGQKALALAAAVAATLANPDGAGVYGTMWGLPLAGEAARIAPLGAEVADGKAYLLICDIIVGLVAVAGGSAAGIVVLFAVGLAAAGGGLSVGLFPFVMMEACAAVALGFPGALAWAGKRMTGPAGQITSEWIVPLAGASADAGEEGAARDWGRLRKRWAAQTALAGAALLTFLALFSYDGVGSRRYRFGANVGGEGLPAAAVKFIRAQGLGGTVLTWPGWAGYVLTQGYPRVSVFCDTRPAAITPEKASAVAQAFGAPQRAGSVAEGLRRSNIAIALVPENWPGAMGLGGSWAPVYWDDSSAVFVPRNEANAALVAAHDQSLTYPAYFGLRLTKGMIPGIISTLSARVRNEAPSAHVYYELGVCYLALDQKETAAQYLLLALKAKPTLAMAYHLLGDIVRGGNTVAKESVVGAFSGDARFAELLARFSGVKEGEAFDTLALILYWEAAKYDRDLAIAYLRLGELYLKKGNVPRTVDCLLAARRADDKKPQLDRFSAGLRKELDGEIDLLTRGPRAAGPASGTAQAPGGQKPSMSTDAVTTVPEARGPSTDAVMKAPAAAQALSTDAMTAAPPGQ